jgi:hypothetical protein
MDTGSPLKDRLVRELERLPEDRLREVLDFVEYLLSKEHVAQAVEPGKELDPAQDPIPKFIGGVSHGSLAKHLDKELYGAQE